jgi:hypothetical protein
MLFTPGFSFGIDSLYSNGSSKQHLISEDGYLKQHEGIKRDVGTAKLIPILYLLNLAGGPQNGVIVTASSFENNGSNYHPPYHAYDSNYTTRWSAFGTGEWIQFSFAQEVTLDSVSIAFHLGNQRTSSFGVEVSNDGKIWTNVFTGQSSGTTATMENFTFAEVSLSYLRITGSGNSINQWNSYVEVVFQDLVIPTCSDGMHNQDETGIDCGGVCGGNCCRNGYQDSNLGETGIDCGGGCSECYVGLTYYISSKSGNDNNDGLSPLYAWRTIDKVNGTSLQGGDAVLFSRGDTWREELVLTSSGRADAYITYGAYGIGPKPRILGSERAGNWVTVSGHTNVWRSTTSLIEPDISNHPASIFFGESDGSVTWGRTLSSSSVPSCGSEYAILGQEYDWCWANGIYVYSTENPGSRYSFVEVPQRRGSITMVSHDPQEYITIDGFELMFGAMYGYNDGWPMNYEVNGLIIKNCHIGYIGIRDASSAMGLVIWHSDMLVQNNDIHDCGRRSISYNIYTDNNSQPDDMVFENVIFENNTLHNGYHTTGFDVSHGDNRENTLRNFTFRNNLIYDVNTDDPNGRVDDYTSMGLYLWTGAADFENFKIYNNVLKNIKQKGFAIGSGTGVHRNLEIYNNVLYGMNPNISNYRAQAHIGGTHQNLRFNNNIMYGTIERGNYASRCLYLGVSRSGVASLDYNLYYQDYQAQQIISNSSGSYWMSDWTDYLNDTGWDQHSPAPQNPLFVNPDNNDFHLLSGSVGLNAGMNVGLPYEGSAPHIGIDDAIGSIGAIMSN